MAASRDLPDYERFEFYYNDTAYPVYRGGDGPAVIVIHELPGLMPETVALAERLRAAGYAVYLPLFFGRPGKSFSGPSTAAYTLRLCISREFYMLKRRRTSPVVDWLRALCRHAHDACGGRGVGAIGMCLSGGFVIPMMLEPALLAPVVSQPSLPGCVLPGDRLSCARSLDCSPEDLLHVKERLRQEDLTILGFKFSHDRLSPNERFDRLRDEFGEAFVPMVIDSGPDNEHGYPESHHAVLTVHYDDSPGTPTRDAMDRVLEFFQKRLVLKD